MYERTKGIQTLRIVPVSMVRVESRKFETPTPNAISCTEPG